MRLLPALAASLACAACSAAPEGLDLPEPRIIDAPAGAGAAQPFLAPAGDGVLLSWTEPAEEGHSLRYARLAGGAWSPPSTVAAGRDWFVNWADFPSVVQVRPGVLAAHWLQRSGPGRYSYDVLLTRSTDGGETWSPPARPHRDGTETEHGFAALFPHGDGLGVTWLDGRRYADGPEAPASNEMQVRFTTLADAGFGEEHVLDDRACDCCQTAVAATARGPVVFYRDRSPDEVRDIAYARLEGDTWSAPRLVHADGWVINACPVNGPAADATGEEVVVAWFTAAGDTPRVRLAFSADAGGSFGAPIAIDDGDPIGRVDVLLLDDGRALVVWLERVGEDAEVRGRLVRSDGQRGVARTLAATTAGRSGGFPRMARSEGQVVLAWTEPGEPSSVRAAILDLGRR